MAQSQSASESNPEGLSSGGPSEEPTTPQPLVAPAKKGGLKVLTVVLVAIIVVLAAALAIQTFHLFGAPATTPPPPGAVTIQSAAPTATAGQTVRFTLTNLQVGQKALVHMGDGATVTQSNAFFTYSYAAAGTYLVWLQVQAANGTIVQDASTSLYKLTILPDVPVGLGQYVSVPTIYFNTTLNPKAPVTTTGTAIYLYGNYTDIVQLYSNTESFWNATNKVYSNITTSVSVDHYTWDFGNGQTQTVAADPDTSVPMTNPIPVTYSSRGLYFAQLALVTVETVTSQVTAMGKFGWSFTNTTTINFYSETVGYTIAVGTTAQPFDIAKFKGKVPSPGVITEIVNSAGGPYSYDPQVDYETVGYEVVLNTQATLVFYNGSSTTDVFPYLASDVPSVANGEISSDYGNYTFHIRPNMRFSNGDPVTAYDVRYSTIRAILFQGGYPGAADWIITQYLIPSPYYTPFTSVVNDTNKQGAFNAIMAAVSYDNATNAVTFHLAHSTPATTFFSAVNFPLGMGILDASWLQTIGAGITFTPDGFLAYENQANEGSYNQLVQFQPVGAGPYEVNTNVPHTSVVLTPNPYFPGIPMIPKQNNTIIIEWVSSPAVAYQLFQSGEGDIVTYLPPPYYKLINDTLVSAGQATIKLFPSITEYFAPYNVNVNTTLLANIGPGYSIPSDYFANPLVREAFAYAFNYTGYVDNILGNKKYGFNFGNAYCGVIVKGLPDYVPPSNLTGCPTYDLAKAKQLLQNSGVYSTAVNFPIIVPSGDTTDFTAAIVWGQALASIDPAIKMSPVYQNFDTIIGYQVPDSDPMPLFFLAWIADYALPSDYTDAMYLVGGVYPAPNGWDPAFLSTLAAAHPTQAAQYNAQASNYTKLNTLIRQADTSTDPTQQAQLYAQAEQIAVNLYMYTYTYQGQGSWIVKSYIQPYQGNWGFQQNPTIGAGFDSCYFWWVKG